MEESSGMQWHPLHERGTGDRGEKLLRTSLVVDWRDGKSRRAGCRKIEQKDAAIAGQPEPVKPDLCGQSAVINACTEFVREIEQPPPDLRPRPRCVEKFEERLTFWRFISVPVVFGGA